MRAPAQQHGKGCEPKSMRREKAIKVGMRRGWTDAEADEAVFGKALAGDGGARGTRQVRKRPRPPPAASDAQTPRLWC